MTLEPLSFWEYRHTVEYQQMKQKTLPYLIVDSADTLYRLAFDWSRHYGKVGIDTETDGLDYRVNTVVAISLWFSDKGYYIDTSSDWSDGTTRTEYLKLLKIMLENRYRLYQLHNAKFDLHMLESIGIKLPCVYFDSMLAQWVLESSLGDPETPRLLSNDHSDCKSYGLKQLAWHWLKLEWISYEDLVDGRKFSEVPLQERATYAVYDAYATHLLCDELEFQLNQIPSLERVAQNIEFPLIRVLQDMERRGVYVNKEWYTAKGKYLSKVCEKLRSFSDGLAPELNIASPKQLQNYFLYVEKIPKAEFRATKTGVSTDDAFLSKIKHKSPMARIVARFRNRSKMLSTYVHGHLEQTYPATGSIHPTFNQSRTSTGRLSCSNPNLQNVPPKYRGGIQAREGYTYFGADYSGCELRILAHISNDPVLLDAFTNNLDPHRHVASYILGKSDISDKERRAFKNINFGIIYGMQSDRLSRMLKCSTIEAQHLLDIYIQKMVGVGSYITNTHKQVVCNGYVETLAGRRRYFDFDMPLLKELRGKDWRTLPPIKTILKKYQLWESDAEKLRQSGNHPIQGTNADLCKLAMIEIHSLLSFYDSKLVLQIHDELIIELALREKEELMPLLIYSMENAMQLSIPLKVDYRLANTWKECK